MNYQRDPREVRATIDYYTIYPHERDEYGDQDLIRDDEIARVCKHWLSLGEIQRFVWLDGAKDACSKYVSWGDDDRDTEMSAYAEATEWLRGEFDYDPPARILQL